MFSYKKKLNTLEHVKQLHPDAVGSHNIPPFYSWLFPSIYNSMFYSWLNWFLAAWYLFEWEQGHAFTSVEKKSTSLFWFILLHMVISLGCLSRLIDTLQRNPWRTNEYSSNIWVRSFNCKWIELFFFLFFIGRLHQATSVKRKMPLKHKINSMMNADGL